MLQFISSVRLEPKVTNIVKHLLSFSLSFVYVMTQYSYIFSLLLVPRQSNLDGEFWVSIFLFLNNDNLDANLGVSLRFYNDIVTNI